MTDDTKDETDVPYAPGLDEWHARAIGADAAEQEKRAVEAKNYHDERTAQYYESAGADQVGGFVQPSLGGRGRQIDWRHAPRMWDWR